MKTILSVAMAFLLALPMASASDMTRSFSKSTGVYPGEVISATISVNVDAGETYYLIDEVLPPGWVVTSPGPDGSTAIPGRIRWSVYGTTPLPSTSHTYQIMAPMAAGVYTFSGRYVFEGMSTEGIIGGESQVRVVMPPAEFAEFSAEDVNIELGKSMLVKIYVSNPDMEFANISLWLGGSYPSDLAKFSYDKGAQFTPDMRNFTIGLNPQESRVMRVIIYSTDPPPASPGYYAITLNANTTANAEASFDSIRVFISYPPDFPGMDYWGVLMVLGIAGCAFWRISK
jgi:hypothetical protein